MVRYAVRDKNGYYDVQDVITWFLSKGPMSPKKLQKLLYYAYAWTLTLENDGINSLDNKLFNEAFEAWVHGPVIPNVYHQFKEYGYQPIERSDEEVRFDEETEEILNQVWDEYGHFTGNQLESITHQETPWINARAGLSALEPGNKPISDEDIFSYYIRNVAYE